MRQSYIHQDKQWLSSDQLIDFFSQTMSELPPTSYPGSLFSATLAAVSGDKILGYEVKLQTQTAVFFFFFSIWIL